METYEDRLRGVTDRSKSTISKPVLVVTTHHVKEVDERIDQTVATFSVGFEHKGGLDRKKRARSVTLLATSFG
jgi:hypothetical protein